MKLSFAHMGPISVYRRLIEALGHEVIMPQKPTQRTFDLGTKYSPEFLCFPFKCLTGTFIEALERGAEGIITVGTSQSCRAGFYAEIHRRIMKSLGYSAQFFALDFHRPREFIQTLAELKGNCSWWRFIDIIRLYYAIIAALDRLQAKVRLLRAYEQRAGDFVRVWQQILELFDTCRSRREIPELERSALELISRLPLRQAENAVRIAIVGEVYVVMEAHANLDLETKLASLGVEVVNSQYISHWLRRRLPWHKASVEIALARASQYLKIDLGGHDQENIAHIIEYREQGVDGIIHLLPFGCLPELVVQSILPRLSKDLDLPILSLSVDEQQSTANYHTRIEAFVDLVRTKKRSRARTFWPIQAHPDFTGILEPVNAARLGAIAVAAGTFPWC